MPRPARTISEIAKYGAWIPDDAPDIPGRLPYDDGTIPTGIGRVCDEDVTFPEDQAPTGGLMSWDF